MIFYDSDWNPATDRQAMDRVHRIGQVRDVHIFRLITRNTVEENSWNRQKIKRRLDNYVIDHGKFDRDYEEYGGMFGDAAAKQGRREEDGHGGDDAKALVA